MKMGRGGMVQEWDRGVPDAEDVRRSTSDCLLPVGPLRLPLSVKVSSANFSNRRSGILEPTPKNGASRTPATDRDEGKGAAVRNRFWVAVILRERCWKSWSSSQSSLVHVHSLPVLSCSEPARLGERA